MSGLIQADLEAVRADLVQTIRNYNDLERKYKALLKTHCRIKKEFLETAAKLDTAKTELLQRKIRNE